METMNISEVNQRLKQIEESMVTKEELEQAMETVAILSNEETMEQIKSSEEDISKGDFKEVNSVEDL